MQYFDDVKNILCDTLGLTGTARSLTQDSAIMGGIPEFDSMAVVTVLTALEEHFGITVDDDEISASTFETLGTLVQFVERKLGE
ncbi:acyl carrier protein [Noviherbaspirillum denitrificans]|uniref:Acyl carrier protein n=1 Tax=Noviherbaspirillum denitrificans TaxID=1968433 RepID=A0A254THX7_9BURK|nr:acyl carrier protein [Noviherbaspirillum denitrificans]OWW22246.1 acyl carrier protein [Noviherbaspirillum denitrificans]